MTIHELRIYKLQPGVSNAEFIRTMHSDGETDIRANLRDAGIPFIGAWKTANLTADGREEFVWLRAFENAETKASKFNIFYNSDLWKNKLSIDGRKLVDEIETIDLTPLHAVELLNGPRTSGFHELRHYRLAKGATPRMLAFFEDVRRLVPFYQIRVLAWWVAEHKDSERFLWLREFVNAPEKTRISKKLYESDLWLQNYKPRSVGVIEERILRDLQPIPEEEIGRYDAVPF
ncbi:MAG: hypothetical protein ACKVS6_16865 [Planctomycetota bacterium]